MPAEYKYYDANGTERTISKVLDPVPLTGYVTVSGSNFITVASTVGVFPGMAVKGTKIPLGAFVHSVKSLTVLELWASAWNATTGVFTTSAANANATADDSDAGNLAYALGFDPTVSVTKWYASGKWRNLHTSDSRAGQLFVGGANVATLTTPYGIGVAAVPTTHSVTSGILVPTAYEVRLSDTLAATPTKRDNGEPWDYYILVSSLGHQSKVQARPGTEIIYTGAST